MNGEQAEKQARAQGESKRGRVRRLLINPLEADGFRKSGSVKAEKHKADLARVADDLAYMSDDNLGVLLTMLRTKGQGRARDIWPSVATIVGFAELVEPRPVEELPGLVRWFRSVEGPKAMRDGTLVETWMFFQKNKRPPINANRIIASQARDNRHKLELYRERSARGVASADELAWVRWYGALLDRCRALVMDGTGGSAQ